MLAVTVNDVLKVSSLLYAKLRVMLTFTLTIRVSSLWQVLFLSLSQVNFSRQHDLTIEAYEAHRTMKRCVVVLYVKFFIKLLIFF